MNTATANVNRLIHSQGVNLAAAMPRCQLRRFIFCEVPVIGVPPRFPECQKPIFSTGLRIIRLACPAARLLKIFSRPCLHKIAKSRHIRQFARKSRRGGAGIRRRKPRGGTEPPTGKTRGFSPHSRISSVRQFFLTVAGRQASSPFTGFSAAGGIRPVL